VIDPFTIVCFDFAFAFIAFAGESKKQAQAAFYNMTSKQKTFQVPDAYHRMNFLYQASQLTASNNEALSSYYAGHLKSIGRKVVLRM
jgi:hypothetical protein